MTRQSGSDLRHGATMVLIVIMLPALFALAAFAINVAYMEAVNTEIQIATDAATRAAGRTYATTGDQDAALLAAQEAVVRNPIGSYVLPITAADLEFGVSNRASTNDPYVFTPTGSGNAVRLTTTTLSSGAGAAIQPVFPFFGSSFELRPLKSANHLATIGVVNATVTVTPGDIKEDTEEVEVTVTIPAASNSLVVPQFVFGDLIGRSRLMTERSPMEMSTSLPEPLVDPPDDDGNDHDDDDDNDPPPPMLKTLGGSNRTNIPAHSASE